MRGCFILIFILIPILVGGFGIVVAQYEQRALARMQPVEAEIRSLGIRERQSTRTDRQWEVFYAPSVRFTYVVDGQQYTGQQYSMRDPEYISRSYAESLLQHYSSGETVTAYYDPQNPAEAVLVRRASTVSYLAMLVGGGLFALGPKIWSRPWRSSQVPERKGRHYRLEPSSCLQRQLRGGVLCILFWGVITIGIVTYYVQAPAGLTPLNVYEIASVMLYLGVGASGLHQFYMAHTKRQNFDDAYLWLLT